MAKEIKKKSKLGLLGFMVVCLVIVGAFSFFLINQAERYNALRAENDRIQAEISRVRASYNALSYRIAHFDSDAYIERLARDRFGWARPNEIVFRQLTE